MSRQFTIVPTRIKNRTDWALVITTFLFLKYIRKIQNGTAPLQLECRKLKKPLYMCFKMTWTKFFAKWFRFLMLLSPLVIALRIGLDYTNNIWWWVALLISCALALWALILFIYDCICKVRIRMHNEDVALGKHVIERYGCPGGGKTSSLFYDMKILADKMWQKIQIEYALLKPYLKDIPFWPTQAREDAEEIIEAYNFYSTSGTYPCLWSCVPAFVDGVPVNRLTADHLLQRKRLPYGSILILDEVSLILPQELFRDRPIEIKELCKFPRHIGDFHIGSTEQGKNNMLKDLRSSTAETKCMVEQKWVLKPRFLLWVFEKITKNLKRSNKFLTNILRVYQKLCNNIGYRKYIYFDSGNENEQVKSKKQSFILPPFLNITYDSRAFKNIYRCKDEPLEKSSWEHLRMSKEEIDEIFTKELNERTQTKKSKKKEAEARRLAKEEQEAF